jgi:cytochrome-b5 reductase
MPNRFQVAFLASLVLTFTSLLLLSRFLNSKLVAAGYDISQIILIGLPKEGHAKERFQMADITLPYFGKVDLQKFQAHVIDTLKNLQLNDFRAVEVPLLGTYDLVALASSPAVVVTALIIVATAFYSKVLHTGKPHL